MSIGVWTGDGSPGRLFADRRAAGVELASHLQTFRGRSDVIVLALPRGGVPVAYEVAVALGAPLDIFVVRKLGMPGHAEFAIGAIASGGIRVLSNDVIQESGLSPAVVDRIARQELAEIERREREYRRGRALADLSGRVVILVDDGLATGSTMRAAARAVKAHQPARIVIAVPVGPRDAGELFAGAADDVVCAHQPEPFTSVGVWYDDFSQTTDDEVRELLDRRPA